MFGELTFCNLTPLVASAGLSKGSASLIINFIHFPCIKRLIQVNTSDIVSKGRF